MQRTAQNAERVASNMDRAADPAGIAVARLATRLVGAGTKFGPEDAGEAGRNIGGQVCAEGEDKIIRDTIAELATSLAGTPPLIGEVHFPGMPTASQASFSSDESSPPSYGGTFGATCL